MTCHEGLRYQLALARFMDRGAPDFSGDWYKWVVQQPWAQKSWLQYTGALGYYNDRFFQDEIDIFISNKRVEYVKLLDITSRTGCPQNLAGQQAKSNSGNAVGNIQTQPTPPRPLRKTGLGFRGWLS
jgi:hypothetical protein